jgi:hypothetical protein
VKASVENVTTSASITIQPENLIEGQSVKIIVQIYPAPPSADDVFENLTVVLVSPAQGISGFGPWLEGPVSSDSYGIASFTFDVPTFSGTWNVDFFFPGQYFANNTIYYQRGDWQKNFYISSAQTPSPSILPSPSPTISPSSSPTASSSPSPSSTLLSNQELPLIVLVTAVAIAVIVVGIGLLVYFRKRKHQDVHVRFLNNFTLSISVTYSNPASTNFLASSIVMALRAVNSESVVP